MPTRWESVTRFILESWNEVNRRPGKIDEGINCRHAVAAGLAILPKEIIPGLSRPDLEVVTGTLAKLVLQHHHTPHRSVCSVIAQRPVRHVCNQVL